MCGKRSARAKHLYQAELFKCARRFYSEYEECDEISKDKVNDNFTLLLSVKPRAPEPSHGSP